MRSDKCQGPAIPFFPSGIVRALAHSQTNLNLCFYFGIVLWSFIFIWIASDLFGPVVDIAFERWPQRLMLQGGKLANVEEGRWVLADNTFLAICLETRDEPWLTEEADFTIYLLRHGLGWRCLTKVGFVQYPKWLAVDLSQRTVQAWWAAVRVHLLVWAVVLLCLLIGGLLATEAWLLGHLFGMVMGVEPAICSSIFRVTAVWSALLWLICWLLYSVRQFPLWGLLPCALLLWFFSMLLGLFTIYRITTLERGQKRASGLHNPFASV